MDKTFPAGFDRPDAESPFLSFVASEFRRRGTPRRKDLSKKTNSHPFVKWMGMRAPGAIAALDAIGDLARMQLPGRFVLKYAKGWSARGVMLLERLGDDAYFDHLGLRTRNLEQIIAEQERVAASFAGAAPQWLVEEFVESTLPVGSVPFDYKFYCFNGVVGMIGQFDRNANPPRITLFEGAFQPLRHGVDYLRAGSNIQRGTPLVPLHAPEMLWWAQTLSKEVDSPFVSVDMYDSPAGPVFSEFTYSPGATHKRMFALSHAMIDRFDALIEGKGEPDPLVSVDYQRLCQLARPEPHIYRALAGYAYNSGPRGAERLAALYASSNGRDAPHRASILPDRLRESDATAEAWGRRISESWTAIGRLILRQIEAQKPALRAKRPQS